MTRTLAVFASGGGSNFQAILKAIACGMLPLRCSLLITNNPRAGALQIAEAHSCDTHVLRPRDFAGEHAYTAALLDLLTRRYRIDFIALAGYLKKIPRAVVHAFRHRMVNIHPALLPDYGGAGMYGRRVHAAVLAGGETISGATVHLVDEEYDTGSILLQKTVPVLEGDTPEALAARVLAVEHELYPRALRLLAERSGPIGAHPLQP